MYMKQILLLALVAFCVPYACPLALGTETESQLRRESEKYHEALARYIERLEQIGNPLDPYAETALNVAVPLNQVDLSKTTSWDGPGHDFASVVMTGFQILRDSRFLLVPEQPDFPRRLSWLYPDDGCFARTALANRILEASRYPRPSKLFIFGPLRFETVNAPGGWVYWWYHVVPVVSFAGNIYVLDPAVESRAPLRLNEWLSRIVDNTTDVQASLCGSFAYEPSSSCYTSTKDEEFYAMDHQIDYLRAEWDRLLYLWRNPDDELGAKPPWLPSFIPRFREFDS